MSDPSELCHLVGGKSAKHVTLKLTVNRPADPDANSTEIRRSHSFPDRAQPVVPGQTTTKPILDIPERKLRVVVYHDKRAWR